MEEVGILSFVERENWKMKTSIYRYPATNSD